MEETALQFVIIGADSPPEVQRNIFKRLNSGGLPLSDQEIRHALYFGPSAEFLKKLVNTNAFTKATDDSITDYRMAGRELILRFAAFYMMGPEEYRIDNEMDQFLCDALQILNGAPPATRKNIWHDDPAEIRKGFIMAMKRAENLFDDGAFRVQFRCKYRPNIRRSRINKSLFEAWSVVLADMDNADFNKLLKKRDDLHLTMIEHYGNDKFLRACGSGALEAASVKYRHKAVKRIIKIVLEG
jgi:hypothetical protein